ncbi:MAG: hypothetical protein REJ23_15295 [Brevundimonas sp.]|nr:hypothetical protein [Brevundimonas sp.]
MSQPTFMFSGRNIRVGAAVLAAATFGSVVMFLVTWTSNPLRDWMFAWSAPAYGIELAVIAVYVLPVTFALFTFGVALLGVMLLWVMKRVPAMKPSWLVGAIAGFLFLATVLYELIIGTSMLRALHASNAAGYILDDGLITPLGWWSAGRRGLVAAVVAGLTAVVFLAVCRPRVGR